MYLMHRKIDVVQFLHHFRVNLDVFEKKTCLQFFDVISSRSGGKIDKTM